MSQNVTVAGASYPDVPAILLPKTGGGIARFDDASVTTAAAADVASGKIFIASDGTITTGTGSGGGGGSYPWFGQNTTFVERKLNKTINLKNDTSYDSWTASTTAGDIKAASTTNDFSITGDYTNAYWVVLKIYIEYAYLSGVTLKNLPIRATAYWVWLIAPYFNAYSNLTNGTNNSISSTSVASGKGGLRYYTNVAGNNTGFSTSYSYGVYMQTPSITTSNLEASFKLGKFQARCQASYFATSQKAYIDSVNTNIIATADVYKTPCPNSYISWIYENVRTDCTSGL